MINQLPLHKKWKIEPTTENYKPFEMERQKAKAFFKVLGFRIIIVYCIFCIPTVVVASPIDLIYFRIETNQFNQNQLVWATTWNLSNNVFTIEKSSDGKEYLPIGNLQGSKYKHGVDKINFHFCDPTHWVGQNYYRLKIEAPNGNITYSSTQKIYTTNTKKMFIYPRGQKHVLNLHPGFSIPEGTTLEVLDRAGQHIITKPLKTGSVSINVNIGSLPPGNYTLNLLSNQLRLASQKLIKS